MDILDIDKALKDDSFICWEDKTHDEVSNILQQWKSNNCLLPTQYQQEQAYKLNSRTFTRPRRKSTQNLESHFAHLSGNIGAQSTPPTHPEQLSHTFTSATPQPPMFNLEIGGLVTTMHKSFLQDTSPPSLICSSMDMSMERMNNSLITSADFTNINFLQSTQSLDFNEPMLNGGELFNLANKATNDGYTLSDMIRDRKALESLTMSGDGTLIKDSHIGQIDDISLALSKTASGCSTMDNSTESMKDEQRNGINIAANTTTVGVGGNALPGCKSNIMHRTMLLSDDVISDTTFDLVESSLCESFEERNENDQATAFTSVNLINETFKRPRLMDETVCLPIKVNTTFESKQLTPDARLASDTRCETPENVADTVAARKFYESTPHATALGKGAQNLTPTTSKLIADEMNLSPIVGAPEKLNATRVISETFGHDLEDKKINLKTFSGTMPHLDSIEQMLEDIENPNESYEKVNARREELRQNAADLQMQNVLELAHAEEELLASNNDQEFEHMLEEFSKVEVNAEHVKMKKSLETIKRRFNRDTVTLGRVPALQHGANSEIRAADLPEKIVETNNYDCQNESRPNGRYSKADVNSSSELKRSLLNDCSAPSGLSSPSPSSALASGSSTASSITASLGGNTSAMGERLLSRRSRLYDNINLSTISAGSANHQHSPSRSLGASFTVHKREDNEQENCVVATNAAPEATEPKETEHKDEENIENLGKTEESLENAQGVATFNNYSGTVGTYKLSERRERDRDRFKTIKIIKEHSANDDLVPVNVPCIDDEIACEVDNVPAESAAVFNNNKSEIETEKDAKSATGNQNTSKKSTTTSKINPNFLTYKKPKEKPPYAGNLPEIASIVALASNEELEKPPEPPSRLRSRSRPRYISGLQKMTVVKATSAGDLDRATAQGLRMPNSSASHAAINNCHDANAHTKYNRNPQPLKTSTDEVKSPMGTKSKSFHNLSSNFGFNGSANGLSAARNSSFGLRKPTTIENNAVSTNTVREQTHEAVFKVPKLVSGLRAPGVKRAGLVRPSSGYYSLNSLAAKGMPPLPQAPQAQPANDVDSDSGGRHSPTESMSSASSRGSLHSGGGGGGGSNNMGKPVATATASKPGSFANNTTLNLTKITTGSTGIPKPSGLRPPTTSIKRSGLPKPATAMVRR